MSAPDIPATADASSSDSARRAVMPDPLIPLPKIEALLALADAGVGVEGLRAVALQQLGLGAAQFEVWLRLNRVTVLAKAAFFNRGI